MTPSVNDPQSLRAEGAQASSTRDRGGLSSLPRLLRRAVRGSTREDRDFSGLRMARRLRAHGWLPILLLPMAILVSTRPLSERRSLVLADSTAITVGLGVVVSAGSMWEMSGESGLVRLAAEAVLEEIAPQLSVLGVDAQWKATRARSHKFVMRGELGDRGRVVFQTLFTGRVGAVTRAAAARGARNPGRRLHE